MKSILKLYVRIHEWVHRRVLSRLGCATYGGIHPKEIYGNRYRFFKDNVCGSDVVLDVACGTGTILYMISDYIKCGIGVDFSESQLRLAIHNHHKRNIEFWYHSIHLIDYDELEFNVAIFSHILEHIEDVPRFLRKVNANKILICVPSKEDWYSKMIDCIGLDSRTDASHCREYDRGLLERHVVDAGYLVEYMGFNEDGNIVCRAVKSNEK